MPTQWPVPSAIELLDKPMDFQHLDRSPSCSSHHSYPFAAGPTEACKWSASCDNSVSSARADVENDETVILKENLSRALDKIAEQELSIRSLKRHLDSLEESTLELNGENDEILNDMDDVIKENEELRSCLEQTKKKASDLAKMANTYKNQRDKLAEKIEEERDESLDPEEVANLTEKIRVQTKMKLAAAASEKENLLAELKVVKKERDENAVSIERMGSKHMADLKRLNDTIKEHKMKLEDMTRSHDKSSGQRFQPHRKKNTFLTERNLFKTKICVHEHVQPGDEAVLNTNSMLNNTLQGSHIIGALKVRRSSIWRSFFDAINDIESDGHLTRPASPMTS